MYSVISDPLDTTLTAIAKGQRQDIVDVINKALDDALVDKEPSLDGLSDEMTDYVKTVKVILGLSLYSDSWLEV